HRHLSASANSTPFPPPRSSHLALYGAVFDLDAYIAYIRRHGYPVQLLKEMDIDEIMHFMQKDKKNHRSDYISYVVFEDKNTPAVTDIKIEDLQNMLTALKERI